MGVRVYASTTSAALAALRTTLLVLPGAVTLGAAFLRLDTRVGLSRRRWVAWGTGALLGAFLAECVHGLLGAIDPGPGLRATALGWCGGYAVVLLAVLALRLLLSRVTAGKAAPARPAPGGGRVPAPRRVRWPGESDTPPAR